MTDWMHGSHSWTEFLERLIIWKKKMLKIDDMYPVMQPSDAVASYSLLLCLHFFSWFSTRSRYKKDFPQSSHPHCIRRPWLIIYVFWYYTFHTLGLFLTVILLMHRRAILIIIWTQQGGKKIRWLMSRKGMKDMRFIIIRESKNCLKVLSWQPLMTWKKCDARG